MKRIHVKGNTWVLEGPQLVGLYQIDESTCLLLDPGSTKLQGEIEAALSQAGLTPVGVLCTHMHYDHHESTRYFRETYGAQTCLPQLEADIVRSEESLKNHLFNFTMGMIRTIPRLQNLVCPVDRVIAFGETELVFCGVPLQVVRTPGHAPDHVCFITPDNVCFAGDVLMTDLDTLRQDIERNTLYPYGVNMEYRDGTKAEADIEKWEAMELCEKDALKTWRYLYAPEQVTEWQHHYSNLFSQWKAQAFSYMPQDLEERLNVEYMEEAQNPDTDMYRIPLGTAKQLLLDGASVYRLLPGGAEKIAPIAAVRAGLWYEHYREFAVTPEDLGALDRLVRRETDRLMRIRPQLDKSQERRPSPER